MILLRLLAPYIAVGIFWCVLDNAWLAILAYHAQILLWSSRGRVPLRWRPTRAREVLFALPAVTVGPLVYYLLPVMTHSGLAFWLSAHALSGLSFVLMVPYFGIVHPILEQRHWAPLRARTPLAHAAFAGYHLLVLYSLLTIPWLVVSFCVLILVSMLWRWISTKTGSLAVAVVSHVLADLGIIVVALISK